jgi:hypothetical protein
MTALAFPPVSPVEKQQRERLVNIWPQSSFKDRFCTKRVNWHRFLLLQKIWFLPFRIG